MEGNHYLQRSRRGQVISEQYILSGHDIVYRIGKRISGHPNCARTDESWKEKEMDLEYKKRTKTHSNF